ncbi:MAG TPA: SoxR reducing system RseC family protein [Candidatus Wallbacteria bacterium]|nr:MAG: Positive regulator of sigma(E), RseC/MucC [bacterium ADurb.Bin243]HOD42621.1 SoxR reducing system RseC family protein [Candidatus Wallbacteria bacterium]HPG56695.1 SoxR reducing system RseC family protein [Candidatus Wallbacteria bacterium]
MIEEGKVVRIEDDYIFIELKHNEFCSKCWRCVEEFEDEDELMEAEEDEIDYEDLKVRQVLKIKNEISVEMYDRVEIEVANNIFYVNLLLEYILPVGDFIIGFVIAYYFSSHIEYSSPLANGLALGTIFFTLSYWLARFFSSEILQSWNKYPRITRVIRN